MKRMSARILNIAFAVPLSAPCIANARDAAPHRVAVLVGANAAAPGRKTLRYSHQDVRAVALATLENQRTLVALDQSQGPLQPVDLRSGLIVLEVPPGPRQIKLAVPPGKYLARRRDSGQTLAQTWSSRLARSPP